MLRLFFVFIFFLSSGGLFAQHYEKEFEKLYAWEVKQLDEFIERFNNDSTMIRQYVKKYEPGNSLSRERMIKSLFNAESKHWDFAEVNRFIKEVVANDSQKLSLSGGDFHAQLTCPIYYKKKKGTAVFNLELVQGANGGLKWVVSDVDADYLKSDTAATSLKVASVAPAIRDEKSGFLNPMSHATDFMNIDLIARSMSNPVNFFVEERRQSDLLKHFIRACSLNQVQVESPIVIAYRIGQIKGWMMEIRQFSRENKNSGWLISKLEKTNTK